MMLAIDEQVANAAGTAVSIALEGNVQGVGFRPFVLRLATSLGLTGWVRNVDGNVEIEVSGNSRKVADFCRALVNEAPPHARVVNSRVRRLDASPTYADFRIRESDSAPTGGVAMLTPDLAMCLACREELHNPENRRYRYPFITCTDCGPRFSVLLSLPYDRIRTSMQPFGMCDMCAREYADAGDRRLHSQTNSCPACGISLTAHDRTGAPMGTDRDAVAAAVRCLQREGIAAIKGIGGFLLLCDATNKRAVTELRRRKARPAKPFAVMYPDMEAVRRAYVVSPREEAALTSAAAPIVLLRGTDSRIAACEIAPGLSRMGVFLPYAPLLELVVGDFGYPVVATSANLSGSALVYDEAAGADTLRRLADVVLVHNREIRFPQDDGVVQYAPASGRKIVLRTGRGTAPVHFRNPVPARAALAFGAMMKSSFALAQGNNIYVSPYLGDTESFDAQESFRLALDRFRALTAAGPQEVVVDRHPGYPTRNMGISWAAAAGVSVEEVQHHRAHFAAVLFENGLLETPEPVMGVVWDGNGLGDDGQLWGGEFFAYRDNEMKRVMHFGMFPVLLGDKMAREPRLSALAIYRAAEKAERFFRPLFDDTEWQLYTRMAARQPEQTSNAVGRLFDAVAALLGFGGRQRYEGEAARWLEERAWAYRQRQGGVSSATPYGWTTVDSTVRIDFGSMIDERLAGTGVELMAYRFHLTLVAIVGGVARRCGFRRLAFSGGVFQNALLIDMLHEHLGGGMELFFHRRLAPNDENIALGQLAYRLAACK